MVSPLPKGMWPPGESFLKKKNPPGFSFPALPHVEHAHFYLLFSLMACVILQPHNSVCDSIESGCCSSAVESEQVSTSSVRVVKLCHSVSGQRWLLRVRRRNRQWIASVVYSYSRGLWAPKALSSPACWEGACCLLMLRGQLWAAARGFAPCRAAFICQARGSLSPLAPGRGGGWIRPYGNSLGQAPSSELGVQLGGTADLMGLKETWTALNWGCIAEEGQARQGRGVPYTQQRASVCVRGKQWHL